MKADRPRFDPTVNLGHLISLGGVIVTIIGGWYVMDHRLSALERNFEKLSVAVVELVRFDERLKEVARRVENLERR
jgi:hypothetical protein